MATCAAFAGEDSPILEPLHFEPTSDNAAIVDSSGESCCCPCVLCGDIFCLPENKDSMLKHFLLTHKLVIANVDLIAHLSKYLSYWKKRFSEHPLTDFCSVIKTNAKVSDPAESEFYFVLCDALPEDKEIRSRLQMERLELILELQQKERKDENFSRTCLFCRHRFEGNRAELFNHMTEHHHFNVGHPDNLVYTNEFLDLLEDKLRSLKCLYCEKTFKDADVLREHMRKKRHKKLHEGNAAYHRFYVINYLEIGKNWKDIMSEEDGGFLTTSEGSFTDEVEDWVDSSVDMKAVCLFCEVSESSLEGLLRHLKSDHRFDFQELTATLNLNYYHQVKLVNFIRRQMRQHCCTYCLEKFASLDAVLEHMTTTGHMSRVPVHGVWDQPEFYFPTYEDDNFLYMLQTDDDKAGEQGTSAVPIKFASDVEVIPEEFEFDEETLKRLRELNLDEVRNDHKCWRRGCNS